MKNYFKMLLIILIMSLTKTYAQCPCSGSLCVNDAVGLQIALQSPQVLAATALNPVTIIICPLNGQPINLGEIDPSFFPLTVPAYVTLQGDYDFFNYNAGIHSGTTLKFPYLYKYGKQCGQQFTNASNTIPGGDNNGYNDELINTLPNYNTSAPPGAMPGSTPYIGAIIFKLMQGAQLRNLCIVGPKTDIRETDMSERISNSVDYCLGNPAPSQADAIQGTSSAVLMQGKDTRIENCEIYGFPMFGVLIRPLSFIDNRGDVYINRCYIHNNKCWGYGYGVWHSGGGGNLTCDYNTPACSTRVYQNGWTVVPTALQNSPYRDHVLHLDNTFFFENGKDFDASGDRNTVYITHCTFSERVAPGNPNINRHEEADVCNDYRLLTLDPQNGPCKTAADAITNPHPNKCQACNFTIKEAGGNRTWIWYSFFYKRSKNMTLTYPNTFEPNFSNLSSCNNPVGFGKAPPLIHVGRDPNAPSPINRESWNYFINPRTSTWGRISIAFTDVNDWDPNDPHIETKYYYPPPSPGTDGRNLYVADESNAPVPMLEIFSMQSNTTNPAIIYQGSYVDFFTTHCRDAAFNMNTDMVYMWRFHEQPYDHADEIRTASLGTNSIGHYFNKVGITNVNLMAIDVNNNFAASNIATQQITVRPSANNGHYVMVVNLKDTYDGRHLTGSAPCITDRIDDYYDTNTNSWIPYNPIDRTPTGFEKFIEINGAVIWSEDVALDYGGWERVELNVEDWISSDGSASQHGAAIGGRDRIEIGIRPIAQGADANMVRGVSLYVDDVYIQGPKGANAIANGDFEKFDNGSSTLPAIWINTGASASQATYSYQCNGNLVTHQVNIDGAEMNRDEVRSGHTAWWTRIPAVVVDEKTTTLYPYYPGIHYNGGVTYRGIKQEFNVTVAAPPRLADTTEVIINPSFSIQPNPAQFNTVIKGFITSIKPNENYNIKVVAPDGAVVYNNSATGYEFEFKAQFPPGVYFVNVQSKSYSGFKKLVVVK